ncbi:abortive infection family protein [Blastopirellula sp. J2-11]|uniref:abortive infection family protein n=1 Tax=Blastopirellula sp. J2-11 TaxID=2943192 RepID=UPI0021C8F1E8|nr:abortive infection family protein [Blastopirellula sp. J2-11]UUO07889.1 abortive infection family protein [Blastopirellula sp. J2-11]
MEQDPSSLPAIDNDSIVVKYSKIPTQAATPNRTFFLKRLSKKKFMSEHEALEALQRIASELSVSESALRQRLRQLSNSLATICQGIDVYGSSKDTNLWSCEPTGDFVFGHFSFSPEAGITLSCRDNYDCIADAEKPDPCGPTYSSKNIDASPIEWLQRAVAAGQLGELLQVIGARLNARLTDVSHAADLASRCLANPTLAIGATFSDVAQQIGYVSVVQDWKSAMDDIATDPASAIARACSLTESVCKHLLDDLGIDRPNDQSISPLFKTTASALDLDPANQAEEELRKLCGGLASAVQNLGALRTKFSLAHGQGPNDTRLTAAHARLAVNAAGNISTFLMEQWQLKKQLETI